MPAAQESIVGVVTCTCGAEVDRSHTLIIRNGSREVHVCFTCLLNEYVTNSIVEATGISQRGMIYPYLMARFGSTPYTIREVWDYA